MILQGVNMTERRLSVVRPTVGEIERMWAAYKRGELKPGRADPRGLVADLSGLSPDAFAKLTELAKAAKAASND